jgi:hypothetical protein
VYGLRCCPGDGGKCVYKYETECYCDYSYCDPYDYSCGDIFEVQCYDDETVKNCTSVCPEMPANTNDDCHLDSPQYICKNTYPSLVKEEEPGTKECLCDHGKFLCSCHGNACPTPCPTSPIVQGDACSEFDGGYCNYTQPCCVEGGGGMCIANSTCHCDEETRSVNCTTLPLTFCPSGTNGASGGNGGQMTVKKKKVRTNMAMTKKKPIHGAR